MRLEVPFRPHRHGSETLTFNQAVGITYYHKDPRTAQSFVYVNTTKHVKTRSFKVAEPDVVA